MLDYCSDALKILGAALVAAAVFRDEGEAGIIYGFLLLLAGALFRHFDKEGKP